MRYLTYSGNNILSVDLPEGSNVLYPKPPIRGIPLSAYGEHVKRCFENPLGMPPLKELVDSKSRVLIAFDDNCQPFPLQAQPDFRQLAIEALLPMLYSYGVQKKNLRLICAIALHRKMKEHELRHMLGDAIMAEFYPHQLDNFDAEDKARMTSLGKTEAGEDVEISSYAVEADLIIYVDSVQIPLNGGHKSVGVGLAGYKTIAYHHHPEMTRECPHVMQPDGSRMHESVERISRLISGHTKIMVIEFAMNNAIYPWYNEFLGKAPSASNPLDKLLQSATPASMKLLPETARRKVMRSVPGAYRPTAINAGSIDAVHPHTLTALRDQLMIDVPRQYDTLVFGLPDLSPYAVDARVNPVLVLSDVLGYVFNWFYNKPLIRRGGTVIIMNPVDEVFHPEYHAAYMRFYDEVLPSTTDPFEMRKRFQDLFAYDPYLIDCYRNKYAHHGFHPFTVWYWATYPLKYLKNVIIVGPEDDKACKRLGVQWAADINVALEMARGDNGRDDVAALTLPPFFYINVKG